MFFENASLPHTIGQIVVGLFFWIMVVKNLRVWDFNIERTGAILPIPQVFLVANFSLMVIGGAALITDYYASYGAIVLIVLTVLSTAMFHRFWTIEDPLRSNYHMLLFYNNVAITGALIMII